MLMVSAPSSGNRKYITTTDLKGARGNSGSDCTSQFGGTSAAAPMTAGIVALVLEMNPLLGWRDVQGILIQSAAMVNPRDSDWYITSAGLHVNHKYGFGIVDAYAAVLLAQNWTNLPSEISASVTVNGDNLRIPDSGDSLMSAAQVDSIFTVEHVEVLFQASHLSRGQLKVVLISPSGTNSILADVHADTSDNYDWRFGSVRHWGESSNGTWILQVKDAVRDSYAGTFSGWSLKIYGH